MIERSVYHRAWQIWHRFPNALSIVLFAFFIGSVPLWVRSPYLVSTAIFIGMTTGAARDAQHILTVPPQLIVPALRSQGG